MEKINYQAEFRKEEDEQLKKAGFDITTLNEAQRYIILEPSNAPENYMCDGEITPAQAKKNWLRGLKESGLSPADIKKAINKTQPMKKAKYVSVILITRVIVDENATEDEILEAARPNFRDKVNDTALIENLELMIDDEECPYDPETDEPKPTGALLIPVKRKKK